MRELPLDSLALVAAEQAYADADRRRDLADDGHESEIDPMAEAIRAYFHVVGTRGGGSADGSVKGYEKLARVLGEAYDQSARGKGKERHANGKPFDKQPIMEIGRMVGIAYQTGQIMKKVQEATTMAQRGNGTGAKAELLGAIVYACAAYLTVEEKENQ